MKNLKRALRVACWLVLVILALLGAGFTGGVPVPVNKRREVNIEVRTELKETDDDKNDQLIFKHTE